MRLQATLESSHISKILTAALRYEGIEVSDYLSLEEAAEIFLDHFGDKKIQGIKNIRQVAPLSLKDSKDLYEAVAKEFDPLKHLDEHKRYALRRSLRIVKDIKRDLEDEHFDANLRSRTQSLLTQVDKLVRP